MSKSASIWSRLAIFRLPRSAEKGQHFQTGGKKKTGAKAQPRYNGFRVISDRVITALQCILNTICWINVTPGILVPCDPVNDHLLYLVHCDLYFMVQ